jgi:hypothetical protein
MAKNAIKKKCFFLKKFGKFVLTWTFTQKMCGVFLLPLFVENRETQKNAIKKVKKTFKYLPAHSVQGGPRKKKKKSDVSK